MMEEKLHKELTELFAACRVRVQAMKDDDRTFFTSLSNKFIAYGREQDLSDEQVARLRAIRVACTAK